MHAPTLPRFMGNHCHKSLNCAGVAQRMSWRKKSPEKVAVGVSVYELGIPIERGMSHGPGTTSTLRTFEVAFAKCTVFGMLCRARRFCDAVWLLVLQKCNRVRTHSCERTFLSHIRTIFATWSVCTLLQCLPWRVLKHPVFSRRAGLARRERARGKQAPPRNSCAVSTNYQARLVAILYRH